MSDLSRQDLGGALAGSQLGQRIGQAIEGVERRWLLVAPAALEGLFGDARGRGGCDARDKGRVLDDALVALGGEEGVAGGGVFAKRLLGGEGVDGVCDAGVAEGGGGWFLGGLG